MLSGSVNAALSVSFRQSCVWIIRWIVNKGESGAVTAAMTITLSAHSVAVLDQPLPFCLRYLSLMTHSCQYFLTAASVRLRCQLLVSPNQPFSIPWNDLFQTNVIFVMCTNHCYCWFKIFAAELQQKFWPLNSESLLIYISWMRGFDERISHYSFIGHQILINCIPVQNIHAYELSKQSDDCFLVRRFFCYRV